MTAEQILNREFLEIRGKILELAASLDRMERSQGDVAQHPRRQQLREALGILLDHGSDRAERVQLLFSRPYHDHWPADFELALGCATTTKPR
jgi:hypothetical protein